MTPSPWQASQRPPLTLNENRPGPEPARLGVGQHREQLADEREQPGVGRRVRPRRAADRRLIDLDHLVDAARCPRCDRARPGSSRGAVELARQRAVEDVVDERRLARAADAGDRGEHAERNRHVDVLEVVRARAADDDLALAVPGAGPRGVAIARSPRRYAPVSEPCVRLDQLGGRALEDHVPAVLAGARAEIDDVVGRADRLLVVLDDDTVLPRSRSRASVAEQRAVVALMQADRRLVEHVEHAGQVRADLRRQPDALAFAARQRRRAAPEREIADADIVEEPQPVADFAQDPARRSAPRARSARARRTPSSASEIGRST